MKNWKSNLKLVMYAHEIVGKFKNDAYVYYTRHNIYVYVYSVYSVPLLYLVMERYTFKILIFDKRLLVSRLSDIGSYSFGDIVDLDCQSYLSDVS